MLLGSSGSSLLGMRDFRSHAQGYALREGLRNGCPLRPFLAQVNLSDDGNDLVLKYQSITVHSVPERG